MDKLGIYIWTIFLALLGCVAIWFTAGALYKIYDFVLLDTSIPVHSIEWSIQEINDERFLLKGKYSFIVDNTIYNGETTLPSPAYRNAWAAEHAISKDSTKWQAWYRRSNPSQSSLYRDFPLKESISSLLLWGLFIYFAWLRHYVANLKN